MRVFADLHLHSKYSVASSDAMVLNTITASAELKGLNLVGTGDFTHPKWLRHIKASLVDENGAGFYHLKAVPDVSFVLTSEVNTNYAWEGQSKRVHHVILAPSLEVADQVNESLAAYGDLSSDGRPTLSMSSEALAIELTAIDDGIELFPAHVWTPHYSLFGSHGHASVSEAYGQATHRIHALETGLSSDPQMNWRVSALDRFLLVSNSDSHSPYLWRIGREANVLELHDLTYRSLLEAFRLRGSSRMLFTLEAFPQYGKYHWPGHRRCGLRVTPTRYRALGGICPVCHKRLTPGVAVAVEMMADRPLGYKPAGSPGFIHILPLSEVIASVRGYAGSNSHKTRKVYDALVPTLGTEYEVMIDLNIDTIARRVGTDIATAIKSLREDQVHVEPGYDGSYGSIIFRRQKATRRRGRAINS